MATDEHQLLTIPKAASILGVSPATLRKWHAERRLPTVKLGRAVRVRLSDVERIAQRGLRQDKP